MGDNQSQRRNLLRIIGVKNHAYHFAYFISDFILYFVPVSIFIMICFALRYSMFTDYYIVKTFSLSTFGLVIIPITYLLSLFFKDQDYAFRNSGVILYTLGFMIADAFASNSEKEFYVMTPEEPWKLIVMLYPFNFHYWTQGYSEANVHTPDKDYNFNCQVIFTTVYIFVGFLLATLNMFWD